MEYHVASRRISMAGLFIYLQMLTALRGDSRCSTDLNSCSPGNQVTICPSGAEFGFYCEKCTDRTFQPDVNVKGDRCRFRKSCRRRHMTFKDKGSTTRDADCTCKSGYHFENEDQRACVPNVECDIGYGQGNYGVCEDCYRKDGYSDIKDRRQPCQRLTQCMSEGRCLVTRSDGKGDNKCSDVVEDLSACNTDQAGLREGIIIGCVMGILFLIVVAIIVFVYKRLYRRRNKAWLNGEKTDDVMRLLLEMSRKDPTFAISVLDKSCSLIEEKIPRQEWALARELFRGHQDCSKYEDLLLKYKGQSQRTSTKAYLTEWRTWKGDNTESIAILFQCLRKCDRDDLVMMICKQFRKDADVELNSNKTTPNDQPSPKYNLCLWKKSQSKNDAQRTEETRPLQCAPDVIIHPMYPALSVPTAPITEDSYKKSGSILSLNLNYPVQVSST